MNKHFFYIAAACVALASCVKNEVRVNSPDKEITFQTVSTKAGAAFNKGNHFRSYVYFLEKGKKWDTANLLTDAKTYIDNADIYYHTTSHYWAAADTYYWPKQGSLTFFAWTDDTADPSVGTKPDVKVSCAPNTGIKIENYSVKDNPNKDILVAEIAKDKTQNENVTGTGRDWTNGVPTVFRHALAKVEFMVNKKKDYKNVKFNVKSITLNGVSTKGTFTQGSPSESWGWSNQTEPNTLSVFTGDEEVTKTAEVPVEFNTLQPNTTPGKTDYFIVLPQVLKDKIDPKLTIVYEIITSYTGTDVIETVEDTKDLKDIYKNDWECKKNYVLKITLGLNEIYWDPSVEDWDNTGAATDIQF